MIANTILIPKRPALRYHGGKWKLARWIISHFGKHRRYTEAFCGAANVLLQKERSYSEVINDKCQDVVNLFRILRDEHKAAQLLKQLELTPYSREEFDLAYHESMEEIEQARKLIIRSFMGFGSAAHNPKHKTGFRSNSDKSGTTPAHDWMNYPKALPAIVQRLQGVVIENRDALDVLQKHDSVDTLHYVDPPYELSTRSSTVRENNCYKYELTSDQHRDLAAVLHSLKGMVVLSGYGCDLYDKELYPGWHRVERKTHADGARDRIEVLWLNKPAALSLNKPLTLFN